MSNPTTPTEPEPQPEPQTAEITFTIESAANDTVIITTDGEFATVTTDATGSGSVTMTIIDGGTYTFTSSVAKDTTTGTSAYSKEVTLTSSTTNVKVMPDGAFGYWYGTYVGGFQDYSTNAYYYHYSGNNHFGSGLYFTCDNPSNYTKIFSNYSARVQDSSSEHDSYFYFAIGSEWNETTEDTIKYIEANQIISITPSAKNWFFILSSHGPAATGGTVTYTHNTNSINFDMTLSNYGGNHARYALGTIRALILLP